MTLAGEGLTACNAATANVAADIVAALSVTGVAEGKRSGDACEADPVPADTTDARDVIGSAIVAGAMGVVGVTTCAMFGGIGFTRSTEGTP